VQKNKIVPCICAAVRHIHVKRRASLREAWSFFLHAEIGKADLRWIVLDAIGRRVYGSPALLWNSHVNNFEKLRSVVAHKSVGLLS
jgi:hypothetical protein